MEEPLIRRLNALLILVLLLYPVAAWAHGETTTTDPENGASLKKAPGSVSVTLSEPPAEGARFTVSDGCKEIVSEDVQIDGGTMTTAIAKAEPGRWEANYRVISTVDGHMTKDTFAFQVNGKKDCSSDKPENNNDEENPNGGGNQGSQAQEPTGDVEDDGSSFPIVPVAIGTAVLVGLALVIRTRSAK